MGIKCIRLEHRTNAVRQAEYRSFGIHQSANLLVMVSRQSNHREVDLPQPDGPTNTTEFTFVDVEMISLTPLRRPGFRYDTQLYARHALLPSLQPVTDRNIQDKFTMGYPLLSRILHPRLFMGERREDEEQALCDRSWRAEAKFVTPPAKFSVFLCAPALALNLYNTDHTNRGGA